MDARRACALHSRPQYRRPRSHALHTTTSARQRAQTNTRALTCSGTSPPSAPAAAIGAPAPAASALPSIPTRQHRQSVDFGERRCNTLHALVASTVGRGSRNNFPVVAAVAPVLTSHTPFYPARTLSSTSAAGSGGTPGSAVLILVKPAAATWPSRPRIPRAPASTVRPPQLRATDCRHVRLVRSLRLRQSARLPRPCVGQFA